jgi:hypothetical protein
MNGIATETELRSLFLDWLQAVGRIRANSVVATELPWFGRRVDVAVLSPSGRVVAFELKLRDLSRAIRQAAYNRLSFDRSYVVTPRRPSEAILSNAASLGVGLIVVSGDGVRILLESPQELADPVLRNRLMTLVSGRGNLGSNV